MLAFSCSYVAGHALLAAGFVDSLSGIIIGLAGVSFNSFTFPSLLAFPAALGEGNFLMFVIGTIIAMVIAFVERNGVCRQCV